MTTAAAAARLDRQPRGERTGDAARSGWPAPAWLLVATLVALGAVIRLLTANRGLFADELSTFWIITAHRAGAGAPTLHGVGGVISLVGHVYAGGDTAEISPPGYFVAAWLTRHLGHDPVWVRLPSLLAGVATIPLAYLLGRRLISRPAGLVVAALTALSPFLIYYSTEARAYSVMVFLLALGTLAMLQALDTGRRAWWILYAVTAAGAMLFHYTAAFLLAGQLLWLLAAYPRARYAALLANLGAALLFAPWIPGALRDLRSPTVRILSALSPFDLASSRVSLEHWLLGYPYSTVSVQRLPGIPALIMLATAIVVSLLAVVLRRPPLPRGDARRTAALVGVLALSVPVGEAIESAASTHVFGGRNLAASTLGLLLGVAALVTGAGRRLRYATTALLLAAFGLGAAKMLEPRYERPDNSAAAGYIAARYHPGDVVIDETIAFSPGPISSMDTVLRGGTTIVRAGNAAERDHPFGFSDPVIPLQRAIELAVASARGHTVFVVGDAFPGAKGGLAQIGTNRIETGSATAPGTPRTTFPAGYRQTATVRWSGYPTVFVSQYNPR